MSALDVIKERHAAASPGPWRASDIGGPTWVVRDGEGRPVAKIYRAKNEVADARFLGHAHEDMAVLIAMLEDAARRCPGFDDDPPYTILPYARAYREGE